jgi:hypothetical protein
LSQAFRLVNVIEKRIIKLLLLLWIFGLLPVFYMVTGLHGSLSTGSLNYTY